MNLKLLTYLEVCFYIFCQVECGPMFDFKSSDYSRVATTSAFVDKSLFIREFLQNNKTSVITAPIGFGKSTNMNMLKTFLEIEVDENGKPKTKANYRVNPVRDTKNYKLFVDNSMKVTEETTLMNEYFGRSPVMKVSFKCDLKIYRLDDAIKAFKNIVHNTFKDYRYLSKSDDLGYHEKQYFETWCDDVNYHMFGKQRVTNSLRELSEYLYKHFGERKVFVLIDDHDSVIKSAMFNVPDDDMLDDIIRFSVCIMNAVLKNNKRFVQGGLISGVLPIPGYGSMLHNIVEPDSFHSYRFLRDHRFVHFYGLTEEEVDSLFVYPELKLGNVVVGQARARYKGYRSVNGEEVYNLYSILKFLESGKAENYWTKINCITNFNDTLKVSDIRKKVEKLLRGESIYTKVLEPLTVDDIADFRNLLIYPQSQSVVVAVKFFSFLLDEGYLSYAPLKESNCKDEKIVNVKIPNDEIKDEFIENFDS